MGKRASLKRRRLRARIERALAAATAPSARITLALAGYLLALMALILAIERPTNSGLKTPFDTLWYTLVTITTIGYGDVTPETGAGKAVAMLMMLSGIVIFGAVSGQIASFLFERQQKKDRGLLSLKSKKNHFLILGWKPDLEAILSGILASQEDLMPSDIVLINGASQESLFPILQNRAFRGIHYVGGDFTEEETLVRANVARASRVLILSDHSRPYSAMEMDSRTVLAVLTIEKLNRTLYLAAELIDEKFRKHLEGAHCDEIILSSSYERQMLISASAASGVSHVLNGLLDAPGGRGIRIEDLPAGFVNRRFGELFDRYAASGEGILIGMLENTGNFHLRKQEALSEAQKNPDIDRIVDNLKKVKELKSNRTVLAPNRDYPLKRHARAILIPSRAEGSES
jgi:voltage-gated potassium channel